jgi:FG-GAP-like repeat
MSFNRWLQNLRSALAPGGGQRHQGRRRSATYRLNVEALEDRITPSFSWGGNFTSDEFYGFYFTVPGFTTGYTQVNADFNGDGEQDLFSLSWPLGNVSLGRGDGTFVLEESWPASDLSMIGVGDFNGDDRPDLALLSQDTYAVGDGTATLLLNNGDFPGSPAVPASSFIVSGFLSPISAGLASTFTVVALDSNGDGLTGCNSTVYFTSSDPLANMPAAYTFLATDHGAHTFSATLKTEGMQSITAIQGTATGTQADITVNPATAASFAISGFPSPTTAGQAGNFTVAALDTLGNVITIGYSGTIRFFADDPQAVLPADYTFTAADHGTHNFSATLKSALGYYQDIYVYDDTTGIGGGESYITVNAAAASTMTVAGFPSTTTAGVVGSLTVTLKDPYGNTASGYLGRVHFTSSDTRATLPANYTFTAADAGVHTFSATLKTAGTQSITVKDTATASITGMDGGITVKAAAASKFLVTAPGTIYHGVAFSLTLTVQDAYGNVVTGYTGTIHFKSTDSTATVPDNYTFTAADNGVHTFTGLVLRKKGKQTITVTDTLNSSLTGSVIDNV